jgi:DNA-binding LacI/PurR family transcriptional regulator
MSCLKYFLTFNSFWTILALVPVKKRVAGRKSATYLEVARLAKVSASTVTRTAAGGAGVSKEVSLRVRRAAAKLGTDLNKKNRTRIIAFLLSNRDVLHPFQGHILLGAEAYCAANGWEMLFLPFRYPLFGNYAEIQLPQIVSRRDLLRGIILGGTNSASLLRTLKKRGMPFAVLGNNVVGDWQPADCDVVSSDDVNGAYELTCELVTQGHRDIWFLGDLQLPWYRDCAEGYGRAMADAGLQPRIKEIHAGDRELGYLAARSILTTPPVTAVFAGNDQVAVGVYRAFGEAEIRIPADISVVGFNDTEGQNLYPALTTVREFPEEIGKHLAELVLERITMPEIPERQLLLPTQLVRRESSSAPSSSRAGHPMKSGDGSPGPATGASAGTSESDDGPLRY